MFGETYWLPSNSVLWLNIYWLMPTRDVLIVFGKHCEMFSHLATSKDQLLARFAFPFQAENFVDHDASSQNWSEIIHFKCA